MTARLRALATAVPPYKLDQAAVTRRARAFFAAHGREIERLLPVFANAGIETRYSCVPIEWYETGADWPERNRIYLDNALDLIEAATTRCLRRAGLGAEAVDSIVTVSTTGLATPSLDARLMERLPFRRDLQRLPVFGLGCAGGALGLGRAAALARAQPGSLVLLVVVELCALTFRNSDFSSANVVASALFGDGAAAVLIGGEATDPQAAITAWGEHTWPDSLSVMGWRIEADGFGVVFSQDIPSLVRHKLGAAVDDFLLKRGLVREDLDGVICHPGGAKVLTALEEVFPQGHAGLAEASAVLRDYGNMSAATLLFVLERILERGLEGRHLLSALGPGFTAGFALLEGP